MQKLFENWREFRKETLEESVDSDALGFQAMGHTPDKIKVHPKEVKALLGLTKIALSFVDPTGITGWSDVESAYWKFEKDKTLASAGWYMMAFIAAIPAVGKLAKLTKTASVAPESIQTAKLALKHAEEAHSKLKPKYPDLTGKLETALASLNRELGQWINAGSYNWSKAQAIELLRLAKHSKSLWKKSAYRGESYKNLKDLAARLKLEPNNLIELINSARVRAGDGWKWVPLEIYLRPRPRRATRTMIPSPAEPGDVINVAQSFTKKIEKALYFADVGQFGRGSRGSRVQVVYKAAANSGVVHSGGNLVDITKMSEYASAMGEQEVMGLGEILLEGFWVRSTK